MTMPESADRGDPDEYVRENKETIVEIIKHSDDTFVRSLCIAALVEYGDDPSLEELKSEIQTIAETEGGE